MDVYTQGHVKRNKKTFYFVHPKSTIFVPDTEKCPSSWLIHLRYGTKNPLKNKEKRLDYIGSVGNMAKHLIYHRLYISSFQKTFNVLL